MLIHSFTYITGPHFPGSGAPARCLNPEKVIKPKQGPRLGLHQNRRGLVWVTPEEKAQEGQDTDYWDTSLPRLSWSHSEIPMHCS